MSEQFLKFLGRGSMFNVKEGNTSAYWKDISGKTMILIDCGCTVFGKIDQLNLLRDVENLVILITHAHSDHIGSLSDLLFYCAFVKPSINVQILCHSVTTQLVKQYLDATGTLNALKNYEFQIKQLTHGSVSIISDEEKYCNIKFVIDKSHHVVSDDVYSFNAGILMEFQNTLIYYSGDTQRIPYDQLLKYKIDQLYVDCAVREHSPGSSDKYPHYMLYDMYTDIKENMPYLEIKNIYAMHLDCDGVIDECERFGINIVEVESENKKEETRFYES